MSLIDLTAKYAWADDPAWDVSWCITVVDGANEPGLVRAFGGEHDNPLLLTFEEAERYLLSNAQDYGEFFLVQTVTTSNHVVAIENNGPIGILPEVARRASNQFGKYLSLRRSPTGHHVLQAEGGQITASFEAILGRPAYRLDDHYPVWMEGVELRQGAFWATLLALLQQETNLCFEQGWLQGPLPTYRIDPLPSLHGGF